MVAVNNLYSSRIRLIQQQEIIKSGNINESNISLFSNTEGLTQGMIDGTCTDGKDDGKIGLWEGIKSFAKGAVKSVTNMFSSPKNFFKTLAVGAASAALIAVTGGAATPFLIAGGAIAGGIQAGKGIYQATQAETDAEKRAALENVGGGTASIAMSVAAGKAYAKSTTVNGVNQNLFGKGSLDTYKNAYNFSKENIATNFGKMTSSVKASAKNAYNNFGNVKSAFKAGAETFKANMKNNADIIDGTYTEIVEPMTTELAVQNPTMEISSAAAPEFIEATSKGYKNGIEFFS